MIGVADLKCLSADNGAARIERRSEATTNQRTAPIAPGPHLVQYFQWFGEQEAPVLIDDDTARTNAQQQIFKTAHPVFQQPSRFRDIGFLVLLLLAKEIHQIDVRVCCWASPIRMRV